MVFRHLKYKSLSLLDRVPAPWHPSCRGTAHKSAHKCHEIDRRQGGANSCSHSPRSYSSATTNVEKNKETMRSSFVGQTGE